MIAKYFTGRKVLYAVLFLEYMAFLYMLWYFYKLLMP